MTRTRELTPERSRVLDAFLSLPLGASLRQVARKVGKSPDAVKNLAKGLAFSGHVQRLSLGYRRRARWVPARVHLSQEEKTWLSLGVLTMRVVLVVARAQGRRVTSREVARELKWNVSTVKNHLRRARKAGIIEGRHSVGYILLPRTQQERDAAWLHPRAHQAAEYVAAQQRIVDSRDVARHYGWPLGIARHHLGSAARAGLLKSYRGRGFQGAANIKRN